MVANWEKLYRGARGKVDAPHIDVALGNERAHRVQVDEVEGGLQVTGVVIRRGGASHAINAWLRNRSASIVGFRIDLKERLVGTAFVPFAGLTPGEFQSSVFAVAAECDRFEAILTGKDQE